STGARSTAVRPSVEGAVIPLTKNQPKIPAPITHIANAIQQRIDEREVVAEVGKEKLLTSLLSCDCRNRKLIAVVLPNAEISPATGQPVSLYFRVFYFTPYSGSCAES